MDPNDSNYELRLFAQVIKLSFPCVIKHAELICGNTNYQAGCFRGTFYARPDYVLEKHVTSFPI
jgi:hypothetical protein